MRVYRVGVPPEPPPPTPNGHQHSGMVAAEEFIGRKIFRVPHDSYVAGTLEVYLGAEPLGEEGVHLETPPCYQETDPAAGTFTLQENLPAGWIIQVKYVYL